MGQGRDGEGQLSRRVLPRGGVAFWSSAADAPRERRPADAVLAVSGLIVMVLLSLAISGPTSLDVQGGTADATTTGLLGWFWELSYSAVLLWAIVLIVAALLTNHRRVLVLEQVGAIVTALVAGGLVAVLQGSSWSQVWAAAASFGTASVYPAVRYTVLVAVIVVTAPHLRRPWRLVGVWGTLLGSLGALALGTDTLLGLVAGLVLGVTVAAVVHLVAGSPGGYVPLEQLQEQLVDLGVELTGLRFVEEPGWSSLDARGADADGRPVLVRVYGRDAWQASLIAMVWQRLWFRADGSRSSVGRQQQAEHEAYLTLFAERAGVPVQPVLTAGIAWSRDALLVRRDEGTRLAALGPADFGEAGARSAWRGLRRLHDAGLVHGDLRTTSLSVIRDGSVLFTDLSAGAFGGDDDARQDVDRAHLLVVTTLRLGVDDAVRIALDESSADALIAAVPYLQPAAFDADTRHQIKAAKWSIADLRDAIVRSTGAEQPPLEKLRRVTWSSLAMVIVLGVVAYVVIGAVAGVGLDTLVEQFQGADWWWIGAAVVLAVAIYVGQALAVQGANVDPLPFVPVLGLETSIAFAGLAVPATAAKIGLTVRFLQRVGSNPTAAATISLLDSLCGFLVQILVVILTLFTGLVTFAPPPTDGSNIGSTLAGIDWALIGLVVLLLLGVCAVAIHRVPRARTFLAARTADGRASLMVLRSPRKLLLITLGSLMWNVVAALVLGCSLAAFGHSATFAELILVNTLVALFSGLMPVPGNVGVAEAAITAGLVAIGIPQTVAMSTAITYRLATYFVPAIYGYLSMRMMRRLGYL